MLVCPREKWSNRKTDNKSAKLKSSLKSDLSYKAEKCLIIPATEIGDILSPKGTLAKEMRKEIHIPPDSTYQKPFLDGVETWFCFSEHFAAKEDCVFLTDEWVAQPGFASRDDCLSMHFGNIYGAQDKYLTLDEAKHFIRKAAQEHLFFYQNNKVAIREIRQLQLELKKADDGKARLENLCLQFMFWDKYLDYVQPPYVAEIYTFGLKAYYFTVDERQRPVLVFQEELPNELDDLKE